MIKAIDDFLMNLAKKMILFSAFLGINRWRLIQTWIVTAGSLLSFNFHLLLHIPFFGLPLFCCSLIIIVLTLLTLAKQHYREDNILSLGIHTIRSIRVFYVMFFPILSLFGLIIHASSFGVIINFFSPWFYFYFLLNQSPQNPLRLRNLLKNALGKIKQALKPAPQPQPQPSPTAA